MKIPVKKSYGYLIAALFILLVLAGGGVYVLSKMLHLDSYKEQVLAELQSSLKRTIRYETGELTFRFGPAFTFTKLVVLEKDGTANFITADKLTFRVAILPLLEKKIILKEMVLDRPEITITRDKTGAFNIDDLIAEKKDEIPLHIKGIRINKGKVNFSDQAAAPEPVAVSLEEADLSLSRLARGMSCNFKFATVISDRGNKSSVALSGTVKLAPADRPLLDSSVTASVYAKSIDSSRFWPYYGRFVPFKKILGRVDLDSTFTGKFSDFRSKGSVRISGLRFDYPQVFHAVLSPRDLRFTYDMELNPTDIAVKSIDLSVDGVRIKGKCSILDIPSGDPRIVARANSSTIRLEDFKHYIPFGIIIKGTADFIEERITSGLYKLEDGALDGRISQIIHMERGVNYNILSIRGSVEKGILVYSQGVPVFSNIKGELEIRGKDFLLHRITGTFGMSPFSLEGKLADFPLEKPTSYPFEMTMTPRQSEIAWLMGKEFGKKLTFSGESRLYLVGNGDTTNYNLSGDWNLAQASYSYPEFIIKPAGRINSISFRGSVNSREMNIASIQYSILPMALTIRAAYVFDDNKSLSLDIKTNRFLVNDVAPLIPAVAKYHPSGMLLAALKGESPNGTLADLNWSGNVSVANLGFNPPGGIKPVSGASGTVNFSRSTLETSHLAMKLGNSTVYCQGSLSGFNNPTVRLSFTAPALDMSDIGFHIPQKELKVLNVQGDMELYDNNLHIKSLSGQVGNSALSIKGAVENIDSPTIDISVMSPHLELNDILLLTKLEIARKTEGIKNPLTVKARIHADTGKAYDIDFEKLAATLLLENNIVYIQPLELSAFGGRITGKGRIDSGSGKLPPRYQFSYSLEKVSADRFMQIFGTRKSDITGLLTMRGELTAKGVSRAELKKSALGSVKLHCEKGTIRKFAILSKIFSILNVSQLLKFQLPDMVSGGMPFNDINTTLSIQDGILSSKDLFIASAAMNISAVGKIDLVQDEVDATIGVQPLQSIDKVVNRIPVVGWILSGDKKTFLTTYFEAKGKVSDPIVKAIPVKSMAKGVLNIFVRLFELPAKLITDTGDVLIGK
jgi:AsmA-like C-terminal region/Domain of Unknown Function (DUF748)